MTLTANTLTFTSTPTQVASTTLTVQAQPVATSVVPLVSICNPATVQKQAVYSVDFYEYSGQTDSALNNVADEPTCCNAAAMISGAFAYAFTPYNDGTGSGYCEAGVGTDATATTCGASHSAYVTVDTVAAKNQNSAGLLQCGSAFTIDSETIY